uniref:Polymerase PB2 n=1 Tax=Hymenopteran orthomyxo-related virus OKIAV175 TaxID=2792559 RepID=A0A7T0M3F0_9ORTO|nr:polymerase PB2 [Hymenopteran orthomyxo-related virus OKIAV175]
MDTTNLSLDKEHLMYCVRMINNSRDETIEAIRKEPTSNMRMIERASRCVKDPNPLSSTMSTMSMKYPLSVDREKLLKSGMPSNYYLVENQSIEDTHFHGRILCKKEAIEWWIGKSEEPKKDTLDVINILLKQHRKEVSSYYDIPWQSVHIQWGTPNLERRRVSTRTPLIQIDPSIRDQAIMQVLMPDFVTPYQRVTNNDLKEIRDLSNLTLTGKMSLSSQIRILINQMDPRRRVLPVLAGSSEITASLKHALTHSNFLILGHETEEMRGSPTVTKILDKFGKNAQYEMSHSYMSQEQMSEILRKTTCLGEPIINYLSRTDIQETNYIKWMKVIINIKINSESESNGLKTSPVPTKITVRPMENMSGTPFFLYEGYEVVNFKYYDIRGNFTHNGDIIINVTTNYTTFVELSNCLAEIAIYCRWGMRGTKSRSYNTMKQEIRDLVHQRPFAPVNCTANSLNALISLKHPIGTCGALRLVKSSEYRICSFENPMIDSKGNIVSKHTNQVIHFPKHRRYPDPIPEEIDCKHPKMINHFNFKRLLKYKVAHFLENQKTLRTKIRIGVFDWENSAFVRFLKDNRTLSKTCRDILLASVDDAWNPGVSAFYYCFCFQAPLDCKNIKYDYVIQGQVIDLKAKKGIFRYQEKESSYFLFGTKLIRSSEIDYAAPINALLDGYKLSTKISNGHEIKSINFLEQHKEDINFGDTYIVYISGNAYQATRDPTVKYSMTQTALRQSKSRFLWLAGHQDEFTRKRVFVGEEEERSDEDIPAKRKRVNSDQDDSVACDPDFDYDDGTFEDDI